MTTKTQPDKTGVQVVDKTEKASEIVEKRCNECGNLYPPTKEFFNTNRAASDGLEYKCRTCQRKVHSDYMKNKRKETRKSHNGNNGRKTVIGGSHRLGSGDTDAKFLKLLSSRKQVPTSEAVGLINLPEQLIRAIKHSVALEICESIMENFPS